ncbi:MAG: META domain-containing protein [Actinomycetales bacterium]|nr:META domain-containing protein [Actinomycetales bacterium]
MSALILAAALPLGLAGCSSPTPDLSNQAFATQRATIAGVEQDLALGSTLTLTFTSDGISAKAGCNTMFGQASLDDGRITMTTPLGMTMMACEPALMDQDQWISDFLSSGPRWSLDGPLLTLTSGDDVIVLRSTTSA